VSVITFFTLLENQSIVNPTKLPSVDNNRSSGSRIIITATVVGGVVFLCIVLIVLLIKYKRQKQAPKLSSPVHIPLTVETPQELLPIHQVNYLRMVSLELNR
jgi:heme/copper-type cytochrome/quinol oxidase subunit 2